MVEEGKERGKFVGWLTTALSKVLIYSMDQINPVNQHTELITFSPEEEYFTFI